MSKISALKARVVCTDRRSTCLFAFTLEINLSATTVTKKLVNIGITFETNKNKAS